MLIAQATALYVTETALDPATLSAEAPRWRRRARARCGRAP